MSAVLGGINCWSCYCSYCCSCYLTAAHATITILYFIILLFIIPIPAKLCLDISDTMHIVIVY